MLSSANFAQNGRRESGLEAAELPSSPPRMRNGLPSTISWVAVPCRRSCGERRVGGRGRCGEKEDADNHRMDSHGCLLMGSRRARRAA